MPNNICVIPARGGSKRILRKNIKNFLGKPILAYSIESALNSGLFSEVIVSTDDSEIAKIGMHYGAKVPFLRSVKNSDDFATTLDVLNEVFEKCNGNDVLFDNICCIYPTAPFVTASKLQDAYHLFIEGGFDSLFPVIKYSFPIQRSLVRDTNAAIAFQFPEYRNSRSQDLISSYHDAGQFYWLKSSVLHGDSIITKNSGSIEIDELEGQDIDNETDWKLAEIKYELLQSIK